MQAIIGEIYWNPAALHRMSACDSSHKAVRQACKKKPILAAAFFFLVHF